METTAKPSVSKRRMKILVGLLISWPILLIVLSLNLIYSMSWFNVESTRASEIVEVASVAVYIAIYVGIVSWITAFYLYSTKLRSR